MCRRASVRGNRDADLSSATSRSSSPESLSRLEYSTLQDRPSAAKVQKRLKKLDKVAPIQKLYDWRQAKMTTHVETFATVSTRLVW